MYDLFCFVWFVSTVYMFGMTLCELFTHDEPFGANVEVTIAQVKENKTPPMVKSSDETCPAAVWKLAQSCINRNPDDRPRIESVLVTLNEMLKEEQTRFAELQAEEKKQQADKETELIRTKSELEAKTREIAQLKAESDAKTRELQQITDQLTRSKQDNEKLRSELEAKSRNVDAKVQQMQQLTESSNKQLQEAKQETEKHKADVVTKSREIQQLTEVSAKQLNEAKLEIQKLREEIKKLQQPPVDQVCV